MGGSQPALGILDPANDHLTTHSHTDVASGGDRISVGEHWVYVAENFPDGSGGFSSFIVRYNLQGEREVPFMTPMPHQSAQQGIIDMAVNPVTGELVYLSPTFGLYGNYGESYNALLPPPSSFSAVTPTSIGFTPEGSLLLSHPQEPRTCSSNNIYESVTTPVLPNWNEQEYWQDAPLAMGFLGFLSATPSPEDIILLKIAGVTAITGVTTFALSRLLDMQLSLAPYYLGQAEFILQKHVVVEEQVEIDQELINEARRIMGLDKNPDPNPDPIPVPWPFPLPQPRPVKPDTEPKECEITENWFTTSFYSWDDYYSRVMSGSPPFIIKTQQEIGPSCRPRWTTAVIIFMPTSRKTACTAYLSAIRRCQSRCFICRLTGITRTRPVDSMSSP